MKTARAAARASRRAATTSRRRGSFEIVGHSDLGARGMNSALAIAGDTAYVGSRIDGKGIAIVDISDPAHPTVVGEIGAPDEGLSRDVVARAARARPIRTCSWC